MDFSLFEIAMLLSFGAAWPVSIYKSYTSGTNKGKSIVFLWIIVAGYTMGIIHKALYNHDFVMWFYAFNGLMVIIDIWMYFRNAHLEENKKEAPA